MLTVMGRDPGWTMEAMARLFAHATSLNMNPVCWEVGFFNARDVVAAKCGPGWRDRPWTRLETVWGCALSVVSLSDGVALIAHGVGAPNEEARMHRIVAGEI